MSTELEGRSPSCPLCGSCERSKVSNTYYQFDFVGEVRSMIVKRRRVCSSCGLPFHTKEQTLAERLPTTTATTHPREIRA